MTCNRLSVLLTYFQTLTFDQLNLEAIQVQSHRLESSVKQIMNGSISNDILQVRWPLGVPPPSQPETRYDVLTWSLMNETHQIMPNSEENIRLLSKLDQEDIKVRLLFFKSFRFHLQIISLFLIRNKTSSYSVF